MSTQTTVSNEMITAKNNRPLGVELLAVVTRIKETMNGPKRTWNDTDIDAIAAIVRKCTKIKLAKVRMQATTYENAAAVIPILEGHVGTEYIGPDTMPKGYLMDNITKVLEMTIDLDKVQINGPITEVIKPELILTTALFEGNAKLTAEEIVAIILHEIGHMFNVFMTLGDYVWLNYYLSDGVEVLLGKKPNKYKLQVLTWDVLTSVVTDPKEKAELQKDPTEANIRRALLTSFRTRPRHYLTAGESKSSRRRDEQLADVFASRHGFARPFVTGMDKLNKTWPDRWLRSSTGFMLAETIKTISTVVGIVTIPLMGFGFIWLTVNSVFWEPEESAGSMRYDNPTERLTKVRRDLIAQLKANDKDPVMRRAITDDIKAIDLTLASYNQHRTVWEVLGQVFSTERRKQWQIEKQEQVLEGLMHNDLFLTAQRFDQLKTPRV